MSFIFIYVCRNFPKIFFSLIIIFDTSLQSTWQMFQSLCEGEMKCKFNTFYYYGKANEWLSDVEKETWKQKATAVHANQFPRVCRNLRVSLEWSEVRFRASIGKSFSSVFDKNRFGFVVTCAVKNLFCLMAVSLLFLLVRMKNPKFARKSSSFVAADFFCGY